MLNVTIDCTPKLPGVCQDNHATHWHKFYVQDHFYFLYCVTCLFCHSVNDMMHYLLHPKTIKNSLEHQLCWHMPEKSKWNPEKLTTVFTLWMAGCIILIGALLKPPVHNRLKIRQ